MNKIHDIKIKDNVTVTSVNFRKNDGTIRILTHFFSKIRNILSIEDKNVIR